MVLLVSMEAMDAIERFGKLEPGNWSCQEEEMEIAMEMVMARTGAQWLPRGQPDQRFMSAAAKLKLLIEYKLQSRSRTKPDELSFDLDGGVLGFRMGSGSSVRLIASQAPGLQLPGPVTHFLLGGPAPDPAVAFDVAPSTN
ncbi:GD18844 [Drosophila simulans]|uniref:GD18844 n=1 Tax=Drosophila simulans TaxID=7240 RepID=B4QS90_DROSI|nr:GD18844 [Drosophila simulans]